MTSATRTGGEWVRRFHRSPDCAARLVCFPHAGGSASYFFPLSERLAPGVETLALQYPGRQDRCFEPALRSLAELADRSFEALADWTQDKPLVLFGHSLGSVLAFETARRLEAAGIVLHRVFASGYPAPSVLRGGDIHRRDDAGIIEELRIVGGTDGMWLDDEEFMASVLPALHADYTAIETHPRQIGVTLDAPLTTLVGDDDPHTTLDEAKAWSRHTAADFDLRVFPGGHFYLDQYGAEIADLIAGTVGTVTRAVRGQGAEQ